MSQYNRQDHLYRKAKEEGYRSRAAYKLLELHKRFRLFRPGSRVLDLGCWPGGWLQVAAAEVGTGGRVVGIDLVAIEPLSEPQVCFIQGDASDPAVQARAREQAGGSFNVVMSDMSPKLSGIREADTAGCVACAEFALSIATTSLAPSGSFLAKLFKSGEADQFVKTTRPLFNKVQRLELDATRSTSNEFYLVAQGYQPKAK